MIPIRIAISLIFFRLTDAPVEFSLVTAKEAARLAGGIEERVRLLEKLNRADFRKLSGLQAVVVPNRWELGELEYSPLPLRYGPAILQKLMVVHLPYQAFGAYENGRLVLWGPVSSGRKRSPTPAGSFHLTWRSAGRHSTVNDAWFMPWYYNFNNAAGLAIHAYALPGYPASHGCIRLLERDAKRLYEWGESWELDAAGRLIKFGTPLLIFGSYRYGAPPPWRVAGPMQRIALPDIHSWNREQRLSEAHFCAD